MSEIEELETQQYVNRLKLSCIESAAKRAEPFSEEFDILVAEAIRIRRKIELLGTKILLTKQRALLEEGELD